MFGINCPNFDRTNNLEWKEIVVIEDIHGCEDAIAEFLSGRDIIRMTTIDRELKQKHELKYGREVKCEQDDKLRGKLALKKYRQELVDLKSKCDAQYINNLNTYYGDGSHLQHSAKPHYACDFVRPVNGVESVDTGLLKSLKVSKRKVTSEWLSNTCRVSFGSSLLRRSFSCIDLNFEENQKQEPDPTPEPEWEIRQIHKDDCSTIENQDDDFKLPQEWYHTGPRGSPFFSYERLCAEISTAYKLLVRRTRLLEIENTEVKISKVLFSTDVNYAFVVPENNHVLEMLKKFSAKCESETWVRERKQENNTWRRKNTVLYLPEFEEEGTQYRRARHVRRLAPGSELFIEMETGMLRELRTTCVDGDSDQITNVMTMPAHWAREPPAVMEVFFRGAKNCRQVSNRVEEVRRTGRMTVEGFARTGPPNQVMYETVPETAVIRPPISESESEPERDSHEMPRVPLTRLFCEDRDCMGLCGTDAFFRKPVTNPLPSPVRTVDPKASWHTDNKTVLSVTRERKPVVEEPSSSPPYLIIAENDHFFDRAQ